LTEFTVLYNPHSGGGKGLNIAKEIEYFMGDNNYNYVDITAIPDFDEFFSSLSSDVNIILTGGDGTLNSFINKANVNEIKNSVYFYASGSGNDFARDIKFKKRTKPIIINNYIKNLPIAHIDGKDYKFINCVGSGMDGYCCGEVERLRALSKRRANYLYAAIKALLYAYKPCTANVTVDGKDYTFKNTIPIAPLKIVAMENCKDFVKKVDEKAVGEEGKRRNEHQRNGRNHHGKAGFFNPHYYSQRAQLFAVTYYVAGFGNV